MPLLFNTQVLDHYFFLMRLAYCFILQVVSKHIFFTTNCCSEESAKLIKSHYCYTLDNISFLERAINSSICRCTVLKFLKFFCFGTDDIEFGTIWLF